MRRKDWRMKEKEEKTKERKRSKHVRIDVMYMERCERNGGLRKKRKRRKKESDQSV